MTQNRPLSNRAFTIMELLVVISIIVILASMLLGGIAIARKMALKAKTSAFIGNIDSGIVKYHDVNGFYPLDGTGSSDGRANNPLLWTELSKINAVPDNQTNSGMLLDSYTFELRYLHFLHYNGQTPRADTYRLWSIGPDNVDQTSTIGPTAVCDDIRNW